MGAPTPFGCAEGPHRSSIFLDQRSRFATGRAAKAVALITLLGFTVLASGCYGGFNLTRSFYKWNGNIQASKDKQANTVVKSLVMVVLVIVPVYGLATLADALVVNSIEFWTGRTR